jgi:eukaryotic translation initiation factor 2-alpha kinase 4
VNHRYDHLISQFTPPSKSKRFAIKAIGLQVVLEQIAHSLNAHQKVTLQGLIKDRRSYGAFSPRRCDVYVISMMPTTQVDAPLEPLLERRVRLASNLWRHGISADLMYDEDIDNNVPSHLARCCAEGILCVGYHPSPYW